ncbi:hypothetical protein B0H13DRAFT_2343495 [Mycena leptocephala]|nr:hypothetical protein B0H13DRAFT_2343495 [Mycena leptocephala]
MAMANTFLSFFGMCTLRSSPRARIHSILFCSVLIPVPVPAPLFFSPLWAHYNLPSFLPFFLSGMRTLRGAHAFLIPSSFYPLRLFRIYAYDSLAMARARARAPVCDIVTYL